MDNLAVNSTTDGERNITFKVEGREDGMGYLSPVNTTADMGIVLIQEWWGMNKNMTNLADKFAAEGYRVITPDIYRGKVAKSREQAGHLMTGLDFEGAVKDILGAGLYLRSLGCTKVGATGFCMGGALVLATLSKDSQGVFTAGVPFYGIPDQSYFPVDSVKVPVLAQFGENDQLKGFSDVEAARNLETRAKNAGVNLTLHIWENANHAFMNVDSPNYNETVAKKALAETLEFFRNN